MKKLNDILIKKDFDEKPKYITKEFQDYGYRLAKALEDMRYTSLYIKMAKTYPREILQEALSFVMDARAKSKARMFMWKVKELLKSRK